MNDDLEVFKNHDQPTTNYSNNRGINKQSHTSSVPNSIFLQNEKKNIV